MDNMNLNIGGLFGAIVCGGIIAAIVILTLDTSDPSSTERGPFKLIIFGIIGGAFAGNYLWGRLFPKNKNED